MAGAAARGGWLALELAAGVAPAAAAAGAAGTAEAKAAVSVGAGAGAVGVGAVAVRGVAAAMRAAVREGMACSRRRGLDAEGDTMRAEGTGEGGSKQGRWISPW